MTTTTTTINTFSIPQLSQSQHPTTDLSSASSMLSTIVPTTSHSSSFLVSSAVSEILPSASDAHDASKTSISVRLLEETSLKNSAKKCLGYTYNSFNKNVVEFVLDDLDDQNIDITNETDFKKTKLYSHKDISNQELKNEVGLKIEFIVPVSGSIGVIKSDSKQVEKEVFIYRSVHIKKAKCSLKRIPQITNKKNILDFKIVKSATFYTGYQIDYSIETTRSKTETSSNLTAQLGASYNKLATLEVKGGSLEKALKGKQIISIGIDSKGFGGYMPPQLTSVSNLNDALLQCDQVEADFIKSLPNLNRAYEININDLTKSENYISTSGNNSEKQPQEVKATKTYIESKDYLNDIAEMIRKQKLGSNKLKTLGMRKLLTTFEEIFAITLEAIKNSSKDKKTILILGKTGAGKSLLTGHMMGLKIKLVDNNNLDWDEEKKGQPLIGHGNSSTTRGCQLFSNKDIQYIDCAGVFDVSGEEAELCNAISVLMITKAIPIHGIILVMNSSCLTTERATQFMELISTLNKGVQNITDPKIWSSILFLINDKSPSTTSDLLFGNLQATVNALINECEKTAKPYKVISGFFTNIANFSKETKVEENSSEIENELGELKKIEDPNEQKSITEAMLKIKIINLLIKKKNLIIANGFKDDSTKKAVEKWLNSISGPIHGRYLELENLYRVANPKLEANSIFYSIATYFNDLVEDRIRLSQAREILKAELEDFNKRRKLLHKPQSTLTDDSTLEYKLAELELDEYKKILGDEKQNTGMYKEQSDLKLELNNAKEEVARLSNDETAVFLLSASSEKAIQPRSWWTLLDSWAQLYDFEYTGTAFKEVVAEAPTKAAKHPGVFFEQTNSPNDGIYKTAYRPAYHNYSEDCGAKIKVYVSKKNHPDTVARIGALNNKIAELTINLQETEGRIKDLKEKILRKEHEISCRKNRQELDIGKETAKEVDGYSMSQKKYMALNEKLKKINLELRSRRNFFALIMEVVKTLDLNGNLSVSDISKNAYRNFLVNYQLIDNYSSANSVNELLERVAKNNTAAQTFNGTELTSNLPFLSSASASFVTESALGRSARSSQTYLAEYSTSANASEAYDRQRQEQALQMYQLQHRQMTSTVISTSSCGLFSSSATASSGSNNNISSGSRDASSTDRAQSSITATVTSSATDKKESKEEKKFGF